jgi:Tfp pilus assembly protein PilV
MERDLTAARRSDRCPADAGFTLIEVAIAILILMVGVTSVVGAIGLGVGVNKAEGEISSRVTTYAQDKVEELMRLAYTDTATDTAVVPAAATGGAGLAAGGSTALGSEVAGYVDYLTEAGVRTDATRAFFTRQWAVADNASGNSKTLTVAVYSRRVATYNTPPTTFVVGMKANN